MGKYKAQEKYDALHTQMVVLKLNKGTDADILAWLASQSNKQGAVKEALRAYIKTK